MGKGTQKRETVVKDGGLAQLGERLPCTQEVRSSILLISTIFLKDGPRKMREHLPYLENRIMYIQKLQRKEIEKVEY